MAVPTVGVALGAGGARGFAHIGVLQALEERGIPVSVVAGSSMGGLVGALYATGADPHFMKMLALNIRRRQWVDFIVPKMGFIAGEKVRELVRLLTRGLRVHEANKPLAIVATDLLHKRNVIFHEELIADAVRASISIPGVFVPYPVGEGLYVDGGVLDPVPIDAAKNLGADIVIAVDVSSQVLSQSPKSVVDVLLQSFGLMQERVVQMEDFGPAIYVQPPLDDIGMGHFHRAEDAVEAGYRAMSLAMDEVMESLRLWEPPSPFVDRDSGEKVY